jgi:uncharacterized protein DUF4383
MRPPRKGPVLVLSDAQARSPLINRRFDAAPDSRHPSQLLTLAVGAVYALVGVLGFLVTGFDNFAAEADKTLLGFEVNPLHNLVHLAIGLAGLAMWRRLDTARTYGWLLAVGYGAVFVYGLVAAGNSDINRLSINGADNGLHLASYPPARQQASTTAGTAQTKTGQDRGTLAGQIRLDRRWFSRLVARWGASQERQISARGGHVCRFQWLGLLHPGEVTRDEGISHD